MWYVIYNMWYIVCAKQYPPHLKLKNKTLTNLCRKKNTPLFWFYSLALRGPSYFKLLRFSSVGFKYWQENIFNLFILETTPKSCVAQINKDFYFIDQGGHWYNYSNTLQGQNNFCFEAWVYFPWPILDQVPNHFLNNCFYLLPLVWCK